MALPKKASDSKSSKKQKDRKKAHRKKKNSTLYVIEKQESIVEQTERVNLVEQESDRVLIHAAVDDEQPSIVHDNAGEQLPDIGVLYVEQSSSSLEASDIDCDGDLDLSVDFADLVLSDKTSTANFQTQFSSGVFKDESGVSSVRSRESHNNGA